MKNIFFALSVLFQTSVQACDVCAGVNPNTSIGLMASTRFHSLGLRTAHRFYSSYTDGIRHSSDHILTEEFTFRFQPLKRFQFLGSLPIQYAIQVRELGQDIVYGMGDPGILANGIVVQKADSTGNTVTFLSIGAGLKFPLGKEAPIGSSLRNLYPGTGSIDLLFIVNYTQRMNKNLTWQTEVSYALKGEGKNGYRFGNSTQANTQLVLNKPFRQQRLIHSMGLTYDHFGSSNSSIEELENTNSGWVLSVRAGVHFLTKTLLAGCMIQPTFGQRLNDGDSKQHLITTISINYLIQKSKK